MITEVGSVYGPVKLFWIWMCNVSPAVAVNVGPGTVAISPGKGVNVSSVRTYPHRVITSPSGMVFVKVSALI
jgi:hypothetical protein